MKAPTVKVLIDTNVIIGLEDNRIVSPIFSEISRKCQTHGIDIYIHEGSKQDIERDKDLGRRNIILSKIDKFLKLSNIPIPDRGKLEKTYGNISNDNDYVDVVLLYTLHTINAVDFLITQDRGIHQRALKLNVADRVFTLEETLTWLRDTYSRHTVPLPYIEEKQCQQISQQDEIFQSLNSDYPTFSDWFRDSCAKQHRSCWTISIDNKIAGIAIRKDEDFQDIQNDLPEIGNKFSSHPTKILKICTFKIQDKYRGEKLGEQLLKQVLWWTHKNKYDFVYLTVYPKHKHLIDMLTQYGFESIGRKEKELYLGKVFSSGILRTPESKPALAYHRQYYPGFIAMDNVKKYLVPIKPEYYRALFPENVNDAQPDLFGPNLHAESSKIPGNAIRKVYVCNASIASIKKGDILLFYHLLDNRSYYSQTIVTVGVVDGFDVTCNHGELLRLTAKRSVFSEQQLKEFTKNDTKPAKAINFLLTKHIEPPINYSSMERIGIQGPYQSIRNISHEHFQQLNVE